MISATWCAGASSTSWYVALPRARASLLDAAMSCLLVRVRSYVQMRLTSSRASAPIAVV